MLKYPIVACSPLYFRIYSRVGFAIIPDYGATPYGAKSAARIGKAIDEWNAVCQKVCQEFDLPFYKITDLSRKGATDKSLVAKDGLHPSGKMYALWVEEIRPLVSQLLP